MQAHLPTALLCLYPMSSNHRPNYSSKASHHVLPPCLFFPYSSRQYPSTSKVNSKKKKNLPVLKGNVNGGVIVKGVDWSQNTWIWIYPAVPPQYAWPHEGLCTSVGRMAIIIVPITREACGGERVNTDKAQRTVPTIPWPGARWDHSITNSSIHIILCIFYTM